MLLTPIQKTYYPNQANYRAMSTQKGNKTFIYFTNKTEEVFQINYPHSVRKFLLHKGQSAPLKYISLLEDLKKAHLQALWDKPSSQIII